eukprot:1143676-Pelagomonas_calceolata.AAC.1
MFPQGQSVPICPCKGREVYIVCTGFTLLLHLKKTCTAGCRYKIPYTLRMIPYMPAQKPLCCCCRSSFLGGGQGSKCSPYPATISRSRAEALPVAI